MFLTWVIVSVYSTFISKTKQLGIQNCNWWFERILIHFSMHYSTPKENILVFFLLCNVAENFELLSNKNATPQFFLWDLFSFLKQIAHFQSFLSFFLPLSLPALVIYCRYTITHLPYTYLVTSISSRPPTFSHVFKTIYDWLLPLGLP